MVERPLSDQRDLNQPGNPSDPSQVDLAIAHLSPSCRSVIELARQEAKARNASHLECDHLLLGLLSADSTAAARALAGVDCTIEAIRAHLGFVRGQDARRDPVDEPLPFSPRAERILLAAERERVKRSMSQTGTLHLLGAMLAERDGIAIFVLEEPGVGLDRVGLALQTAQREKWED